MARSLCLALLAFVAFTFLFPFAARAEDKKKKDFYDLTDIVAVQNRAFEFKETLGLGAGYLPSDAFNKGTTLRAFYNYSFSDLISWEIIEYQKNFNTETQTKKDLISQGYAVQAGDGGKLDFPVHIVTTGLVFTPLYNKGLLFNKSLLYGEGSLYLGAGTAIFNETGNRIVVTPGVQMRFYLSRGFAVRAHFRDHFYSDKTQGINSMIDFGLSFEIETRFFSSRSGNT